jgi:alpha-D-ribose 1-methylphosphonate 5-triphosphate synthase subunit PhnG
MSTRQTNQDPRRAHWLSVLAQTDPQDLDQAWSRLDDKPAYQFLRKPEVGMILVQGRAGNTGKRFNFGEMTVTRCTIQTKGGLKGVGYISGCKTKMSEHIAVLDAMLQDPKRYPELKASLIDPFEQIIQDQKDRVAGQAGATKVNFFTMPRTRTGK